MTLKFKPLQHLKKVVILNKATLPPKEYNLVPQVQILCIKDKRW